MKLRKLIFLLIIMMFVGFLNAKVAQFSSKNEYLPTVNDSINIELENWTTNIDK